MQFEAIDDGALFCRRSDSLNEPRVYMRMEMTGRAGHVGNAVILSPVKLRGRTIFLDGDDECWLASGVYLSNE